MGHLVRTGYDGPISLEIFNDTFRQSDPLRDGDRRAPLAAVAGERGRGAGWARRRAVAPRGMSALALPAVEPPTDVNYVELRTEATTTCACSSRSSASARTDRHRTKSVELWSQGAARIVLGRPESDRPQPTVAGIGLSVRDHDAALRRATELFAPRDPS